MSITCHKCTPVTPFSDWCLQCVLIYHNEDKFSRPRLWHWGQLFETKSKGYNMKSIWLIIVRVVLFNHDLITNVTLSSVDSYQNHQFTQSNKSQTMRKSWWLIIHLNLRISLELTVWWYVATYRRAWEQHNAVGPLSYSQTHLLQRLALHRTVCTSCTRVSPCYIMKVCYFSVSQSSLQHSHDRSQLETI